VSELGRLVADHAKAVMTTDHDSGDLDGNLVMSPASSPGTRSVSQTKAAAAAAAMVGRSAAAMVLGQFQQHRLDVGKALGGAMVGRNLQAVMQGLMVAMNDVERDSSWPESSAPT
jgi:hypothetical protein